MRIRSVGSALAIAAILVTALAVFGIVMYVTTSTYHLVLEKERQALNQSAKAAASSLGLYARTAASLIRSIAGEDSIARALQGSPEAAQARLAAVLKANPDLWSLIVLDDKGLICAGINAEGGSLIGQSRSDRDYFKAIMAGQNEYMGKNILTAKSGGANMFIYLAVTAIRDANNRIIGAVGVFPRWERFTDQFIDPLTFGHRGYAFALDSTGHLVAHGADKSLMLKDVSGEVFARRALAEKNGEFEYTWDGELKHLSFVTDPESGFVVCTGAYVSELTASAAEQRNMLLLIGVLSVLVLGGGLTLLMRRFVAVPIQAIERFTSAVANGKYTAVLEGRFRFELAGLAADIQRMVEELKKRLSFAQGVLQGFVLPCAVLDANNRTTFVNTHMLKALEKPGTPDDYLGQTSGQLIWGDPSRETLSERALREGRMLQTEAEYPTSQGTKVFDVTSTPILDLDGKVMGTLAVWFELTEIRRQQEAIRVQHERMAQAAAAANAVSDQVASASEELAAQIEQSSRGAEEQRNRVSETATAMEQMNAASMEVARSASAAVELARQAKTRAGEGAETVRKVVDTINAVQHQAEGLKSDMTDLGRQAQDIGQILNVIADIADQTNLLALNAAIEAARAGDAGRGFAVVADEVRKLAEKTMAATNEVGRHIKAVQESARKNIQGTEATVEAIVRSTQLAGASGAALGEIVGFVDRTEGQVQGIAAASEEQSAASEEVNRNTEQINRIAGETASAMQQSGEATAELARLAANLKGIISDMNAGK
ncbi:methyl-accepting chemotaxis protein [Megalodesulfovibrio paquesii]